MGKVEIVVWGVVSAGSGAANVGAKITSIVAGMAAINHQGWVPTPSGPT